MFTNVIGQEEIKQRLVELVQHNRLSHALLFLGSEGSGALPWRWRLLNIWSAKKVKEGETDACGVCPSCVKSGH